MKFEEVLPALREGKQIKHNDSYDTFTMDLNWITDKRGNKFYGTIWNVEMRVLIDDNWEIVEEKKKVKLRDLTEEQYKKWFKENCIYMNCKTCPFCRAVCSLGNFCWVRNKDLYTDKFLDQEIEIEVHDLLTKEEKKYKITLTEFWNSKDKLAIHCDTEEKANKLLKAFDKLGKKWRRGDSYLKYNFYETYKEKICYSNWNTYDDVGYYKEDNVIIYEFDEVDLEN